MNEAKKSQRVGVAVAIVAVLGLLVMRGVLGMWRPDGGNGGEPKFYLGPVLPLTAVFGAEVLTVEREIHFDFSPYGEPEGSKFENNVAYIEDVYHLTNPTDQAITAQFAYPYVSSLKDEHPHLSMEAQWPISRDIAQRASIDPAQTVENAGGWEAFRDVMLENDFLAEAFSAAPVLGEPVIVYAVTGIRYDGPEELKYPELTMFYDTPAEGVEVWDYGLVSSRSDEEAGWESRGFQFLEKDWGLLIVRGGDLENIRFQAYNDEKFPPDVTLDGVTYEFTRYESTFDQVLQNLAKRHSRLRKNTWDYEEILYNATATRIVDDRYYAFGKVYRNLYEMFEAALFERLVLYKVFSLTIYPGHTVKLSARTTQRPSTELSGFSEAGDTYDMATRLGSDLNFTSLGASISGEEFVGILDQNFGFDPENDITQVPLDLNVERYYIRVTAR